MITGRPPQAGDRCTVADESGDGVRAGVIRAYGPQWCLIEFGGAFLEHVETIRVRYVVPLSEVLDGTAAEWRAELAKVHALLAGVDAKLKDASAPLERLDNLGALVRLLPELVSLVALVAEGRNDNATRAQLRDVVAKLETLARGVEA